jgi:urea transporter
MVPTGRFGASSSLSHPPGVGYCMKDARLRSLLQGVACGLSQAYGTAHVGIGLAIAALLLIFQPRMFAICAWAITLALLFAPRFNSVRFEQGLYLFNPFLFGCFAFAAFGYGLQAVLTVLIAVPAITALALWLDAVGWRAYFTVPYIAAAHGSIVVLHDRLAAFPVIESARSGLLDGVVTSFAQVLLSADYLVGLGVLIAGLIMMPLAAIAAFAASTFVSLAWLAIGLPASAVAGGLVGYNAVILSFYVGRELRAQMLDYLVALLGGWIVHILFYALDAAAYTFPFVVSGWIYLRAARRRLPIR